jgi:hypothetical protein
MNNKTSDAPSNAHAPSSRAVILLTMLLLLAGALLRLWDLGSSPFKADSMEFYKLALRNQDIVAFWKNPPWMNQIPLNETFSLLLVKAGLPPTPFVVRLPFAIMGILSLFFLWRLARTRFGAGPALMTLTLAVFNPFSLYYARTSYHYVGAMCWSAAMLLMFWSLAEKAAAGKRPTPVDWLRWLATATLACHMHMSVWVVAAVQGLAFLALAFRMDKSTRIAFLRDFIITGLALALFMSRWIYRAISMTANNATQLGYDATAEFMRLLPAYFAGENLPAMILLAVFAGLTLYAVIARGRKISPFQWMALFSIFNLLAVLLYIGLVGGGIAKISYFSGVWPHVMLLFGLGAYAGIARLFNDDRKRAIVTSALAVAYAALTAYPAWSIVKLEGKPTPFYRINEWVQENLPAGTPILTDRWLEPWNELAIHNPGNINYTFTVPDEPLENYRRLNWRQTAIDFFAKYPEAAFLELNPKRYDAAMGPWSFPQEYFARRAVITNHAALAMRNWKIFPTMDFADPTTNRTLTVIYYNKRQDLIERARERGLAALRIYGKGWDYTKPGWQQGQFEDYRIMRDEAEIFVINPGDEPRNAKLEIIAASPSGPKTLIVQGVRSQFNGNRMSIMNVPLNLAPGENTLTFTSPTSDPLFVLDIRLADVSPLPLDV